MIGETFTAYDDTDALLIPTAAIVVFYYADGRYANLGAVKARCPNAIVCPVLPDPAEHPPLKEIVGWQRGVEIDVENTDFTPAMCPAHVRTCRGEGVAPRIYCSLSTVPAVVEACDAAKISRSEYMIRSASWTGIPHIDTLEVNGAPAPIVGTQYTSHADGVSLDASLNYRRYLANLDHRHRSYSGHGRAYVEADLLDGTWRGFHEPGSTKPSYHGIGHAYGVFDLDTGEWHGVKAP